MGARRAPFSRRRSVSIVDSWVIFAAAALGALTAAIAFPRRTTQQAEPATLAPSRGPVVPEPAQQPA